MISSTTLRSSSLLMKFQIGGAPQLGQLLVRLVPDLHVDVDWLSFSQRARCDLKLAQSQPQAPSTSRRSIASPMSLVPL